MKPFLISTLMLLALAPVADAAKFRGQTSQDRRAVVVTDAADMPVRITIFWRAPCGQGALRDDTLLLSPFDESTATFVRDTRRYKTEISDTEGRTYRFRARARVRARQVTDNKWRGRFRVRGGLRRNGEVFTRCDTGPIRWRATR